MAKRVSRGPVAVGAELGRSGFSFIQDPGGQLRKLSQSPLAATNPLTGRATAYFPCAWRN